MTTLTGSGCVVGRCSTEGSRLGTPMCGAAFALMTRDDCGDGSRFEGDDGSTDRDLRPRLCVRLKGLTTVALGSCRIESSIVMEPPTVTAG